MDQRAGETPALLYKSVTARSIVTRGKSFASRIHSGWCLSWPSFTDFSNEIIWIFHWTGEYGLISDRSCVLRVRPLIIWDIILFQISFSRFLKSRICLYIPLCCYWNVISNVYQNERIYEIHSNIYGNIFIVRRRLLSSKLCRGRQQHSRYSYQWDNESN